MARKKQTFADRIIEYRGKNNISQRQFADRVGISRCTLRKAENGSVNIQKKVAAKIMLGMGEKVDLNNLF